MGGARVGADVFEGEVGMGGGGVVNPKSSCNLHHPRGEATRTYSILHGSPMGHTHTPGRAFIGG